MNVKSLRDIITMNNYIMIKMENGNYMDLINFLVLKLGKKRANSLIETIRNGLNSPNITLMVYLMTLVSLQKFPEISKKAFGEVEVESAINISSKIVCQTIEELLEDENELSLLDAANKMPC